MKNYNNYINSLNEKMKWYWWLMIGSLAINQYSKYSAKYRQDILNTFNNLKNEKIVKFDWIDIAKQKVISKVENSDIKNKKLIIDKINKCKIIEMPEILKDYSILKNTEASYIKQENDNNDYILLSHVLEKETIASKIKTITHELFHLVDHHRLIENKPDIKINKNISTYDYSHIFFTIIGKDLNGIKKSVLKKVFGDFIDADRIKYLSSESEVYARYNNLKIYLYEQNIINSPNDDIPKKTWDSFYTGEFFNNLSEEEQKTFVYNDFVSILPFLKNSDLKELNKLAFLDTKTNTNYFLKTKDIV